MDNIVYKERSMNKLVDIEPQEELLLKEITADNLPKKPVYNVVKRVFDIFASTLALVILSPVMIGTMISIVREDYGPPLYKQERIGKNGKTFMIYKFRSMKMNADEVKETLVDRSDGQGANFKMENDPRITKIGHKLRTSSVDELPQLLNIIKGEMSIVGPRPFIAEEQANLPSDRLLVKPGLSCYWQIGGKNKLSLEEQIKLDRQYLLDRSWGVDIKIIFKTIFHVLKKDNN